MKPLEQPELSVIIPLFNEVEALPGLFRVLAGQKGAFFEVVFSDGGSTDGTLSLVPELMAASSFPCRLIVGEKGRGRQLNAGAKVAVGKNLLFLHADSSFPDSRAFCQGLQALRAETGGERGDRAAGRFALRFRRENPRPSLAYYFYEWKARLDRPGCIHGDQGFLIPRTFFERVGPFDESRLFLEDVALAQAVGQKGKWLLLPAEILSSARRFEVEGLFERQILNAFIMNFAAIGWEAALREIPEVYRSQDRAEKLRLAPFLKKIRKLLAPLSWRERYSRWYATGGYVRANAWQLALAMDARRNFKRGAPVGEGLTPVLEGFDRYFDLCTDHPLGRMVATAMVWLWFFWFTIWRHFTDKEINGVDSRKNLMER